MATKTVDYQTIIAFLDDTSANTIGESGDSMRLHPALGFRRDYDDYCQTGVWRKAYRIWVSGWTAINGVMFITANDTPDADLKVGLMAQNERALRDLLLSFPRGQTGLFAYTHQWMVHTLTELIDGQVVDDESAPCYLYRGAKRGSAFQRENTPLDNLRVEKKKHPVIAAFRQSLKEKLGSSKFVLEGQTLVERAVDDGLPVEHVLYTPDLLANPDGLHWLRRVHAQGIACYQITSGLMGTLTTSRPVPPVLASVWTSYRPAEQFHLTPTSTLLIVDSVGSPDNLGMVLRTADAAGVDGVVIVGEGATPFHKNCVRAARGAVGRIPLLHTQTPETYLRQLVEGGFSVVGATAKAKDTIYRVSLHPPLAFVVGNESDGIRQEILKACTDWVRIPMAPGQSSLNVGVAAGILLYECVRRACPA